MTNVTRGPSQAFNLKSRYLRDLLNIYTESPYFEVIISQIYPPVLRLNKI